MLDIETRFARFPRTGERQLGSRGGCGDDREA